MSFRVIKAVAVAAGLLWAMPGFTAGFDASPMLDDADFAAANAHVKAGRWAEALPLLLKVEERSKYSADVYNLLGVTYRKLKDYPTSRKHYDRALQIDPNHLQTLEYQGEWFIETGDIAKARENLARLKALCGECHEYKDLAEAVAKAGG
jgi:tetratricopeptide (TPR) repeat protein